MKPWEPKDYIAALTALLTVGSVIWKGGQITTQLEQTNEAVKQLVPVVSRLDATTAKLEAVAESNRIRIDDLTRRVETLERRR
jgi:hypothetical protein